MQIADSSLRTPDGRTFDCAWPLDVMQDLYKCIFGTFHHGVPLYKNAIDMALYKTAFELVKPNTVIEIGSKSGGSAAWFADLISASGRRPRILSIDIERPRNILDERIEFIEGDALFLEHVLPDSLLATLPRPWLVSEDSAHRYDVCRNVLNFFDGRLESGELIIIEDGIASRFEGPDFEALENGPNRAVAAFLESCQGRFVVDTRLCDFFGYNVTFNPNGWLRKV